MSPRAWLERRSYFSAAAKKHYESITWVHACGHVMSCQHFLKISTCIQHADSSLLNVAGHRATGSLAVLPFDQLKNGPVFVKRIL